MITKKPCRRDLVFQAVLKVLGDKYDPTRPMGPYFYPVNTLRCAKIPLPGNEDKPAPKHERQIINRYEKDGGGRSGQTQPAASPAHCALNSFSNSLMVFRMSCQSGRGVEP